MRILLGVQGTGNGHLSRCSALAEAFAERGIEAYYLVSGRPREALFDMDAFGEYQWRQGLTFHVRRGRVAFLETARRNRWQQFRQDVKALDLSPYDLVLTDYEPITAWAAKAQQRRCIGIGRQFAFYHGGNELPMTLAQRQLLRWFAPASETLGMHWTQLNGPVLPPVIHHRAKPAPIERNHYIVYLPFEELSAIRRLLAPFSGYRFSIFHPQAQRDKVGHLEYYAPSRQGFAEVFARAEGVISNAGFETCCEALSQGKKLLVRPLAGQFEQVANARSLQQHQFAQVMPQLDTQILGRFLTHASRHQCHWPDVAGAIADWVLAGAERPLADLAEQLWQRSEAQGTSAYQHELERFFV